MAQPRRRRLATLTILLLAALTLLAIGGPFRSVASRVAHGVVNPFVTAVQSVTRPVGDAIAGTVDYSDVVAQNHVLSAELASLHQQQVQLEYEQRQLRDLLALHRLPNLGSLPRVVAQTNAQNLSNFAATVQIDKGSADGVLDGMPVVGAGGLVGTVTATSASGATVTLLTDATSSVGVTIGAGYQAVVHGQGPSRQLAAEFVNPGTPVHAGEHVYTSGQQEGLYPAGIPVGTIVTSSSGRGATQQSIAVSPLANLEALAYVSVVLWEPGT